MVYKFIRFGDSKVLDRVGSVCIFRAPLDQHLLRNREDGDQGGAKSACSFEVFQENSEKVLTTNVRDVFLEIFPLLGASSLKFTLCD